MGALAGIITGGLVVLIWRQIDGGIFSVYEILPGFILSTAAIMLVSLADRPPAPVIIAEFDSLNDIMCSEEKLESV